MEGFNPPDTLSFESDNLSANWKRWKQDLNFYLAATEKDSKEDKVKSSIFLHCICHIKHILTLYMSQGQGNLQYLYF